MTDCFNIERICNECVAAQTGRVRAVVFVEKNLYISPENYFDELFWLKLAYKKQAFIVHKIRGAYTPEAITVDGFGTDGQIGIGINNTLTYEEQFSPANVAFYNSIEKSTNYRVVFITDKGIRDGGAAASIAPTNPVGAIDTVNLFSVTVTWRARFLAISYEGEPPLVLTNCAYYTDKLLEYCPPCTPACVGGFDILRAYGNDIYPGTPGSFELDYTFEDVACYPIVAQPQTTPAQAFFDTFDVVENGVIIGSADPARLGITGIFSLADLVAATPLSVLNQSQWSVKYDNSQSWRVSTWYNNGIGGGEGVFKTVKVYVRGFAQTRVTAFCPKTMFELPTTPEDIVITDPKNVYVVNDCTKACLCPELTVSPLTSALLLDGSPAPSFLGLDPNTTYEYSLTGNFIDADYQRKICCGNPSVMFVFVGSKLTVVLNASNVGPVVLDGVTLTYDPITYTVTVETPADVTGINITAVASLENCEAVNYAFELGDCASVIITIQPESNTDIAGYLAANPSVNAAIAITGFGTGVTYLSGYNYEWAQPQTDTMTINANIVAPNDRYPTDECCPQYDPDFISGSLVEFIVSSPCGGGIALSQSSPTGSFQNYDFQWQLSGGSAEIVITNLLDPLENPCDLDVHIQCVLCGAAPGVDVSIEMVNACSPTLEFINANEGPAAAYLAANPGVDAVIEYEALGQLIYVGGILGNEYTWNSNTNNALLRCYLTEQPGNPLSCCPNYAAIVNGETGSIEITSLCLSTGSIVVDFANPVIGDSGYTFVYANGPGYFGVAIVNDSAPTPNPCPTFAITPTITLCPENVSDLTSAPVLTIT